MRKGLIIAQEGQLSDEQLRELDALVKRHYAEHVSAEPLSTIWTRIPPGQAFTKYEDSRSSLVTMECPNDFAQERRVAMMKALEGEWLAITGQHPDQLMIALVEEDLFAKVFESTRARLSVTGKIALALRIVGAVARSRWNGAPIQLSPNL